MSATVIIKSSGFVGEGVRQPESFVELCSRRVECSHRQHPDTDRLACRHRQFHGVPQQPGAESMPLSLTITASRPRRIAGICFGACRRAWPVASTRSTAKADTEK